MALFSVKQNSAERHKLKIEGFGSEFALRDFFADNLENLIGVRFVKKEYPITEGRIDTLGIDENNSPVIIEYKWKENEEVLAQGLFYYNWLLLNKRHFELLVEKSLGEEIKVNWDQPRVILIAQGFSRYVTGAVQQQSNVELVSYRYYDGEILELESIYAPRQAGSSTRVKSAALTKSAGEYDLRRHLETTSSSMADKFLKLRDKIVQLPEVEEKDQQKSGITYKTTKSFVRFEFRPSWIQVLLRDAKYIQDMAGDVSDVTSNHWGYRGSFKFMDDTDIDYLFELIQASYQSTI